MELDTTFFALAVPAVLFAGISKGGFGSGAAFAATPILALILEPAQAVGLMLPLLMLMDIILWRFCAVQNLLCHLLGHLMGNR